MPWTQVLPPNAAVPIANICFVNGLLGIRIHGADSDDVGCKPVPPSSTPVVLIESPADIFFEEQRVWHFWRCLVFDLA